MAQDISDVPSVKGNGMTTYLLIKAQKVAQQAEIQKEEDAPRRRLRHGNK